jgi:hypothetical protein
MIEDIGHPPSVKLDGMDDHVCAVFNQADVLFNRIPVCCRRRCVRYRITTGMTAACAMPCDAMPPCRSSLPAATHGFYRGAVPGNLQKVVSVGLKRGAGDEMGWTTTLACHVGYRTILMSSPAVGSRLAGSAWLRRSRGIWKRHGRDRSVSFPGPRRGLRRGVVSRYYFILCNSQ